MRKLIVALATTLALSAHAEFVTGNHLLQTLKKDSALNRAVAMGYIVGIADAAEGTVSCLPPSVTIPQVINLVEQWMENNPQLLHNTGDRIVVAVLGQAWPCGTNKGGGRGV